MKIQFCILDADYIEDGVQVRLWGKTKDGRSICALVAHEPYFYVLPKASAEKALGEVEKALKKQKDFRVLKIEKIKRKLAGNEAQFLKIFVDLPQNVPKARDAVKSADSVAEQYEYTINFYKRFLLDFGFSGMQWLEAEGEEISKNYACDMVLYAKKIRSIDSITIPNLKLLAFDIETVEQAGKQKIIMISFFGKNFRKIITTEKAKFPNTEIMKSKGELLERFVQIVNEQDPDILLTYNGDAFDFSIIQKRAEENRVKLVLSRDKSHMKFARRARISSAHLVGRVHIDIFNFINSILSPHLQTEVLSLDAVSAELLGDRKIELEYEELLEMWRKKKDLSKLAEYCLKDSELTFRLGEFLLPQIYELSRLVGQLPFDTSRMTYSQLVEWYLSKKAFALGEIIPNQPKWDDIQERRLRTPYIGGFVKEPLAGIHESIAVLDFRSMYPSIIATFNISPEMLRCACCKDTQKVPGLQHWFCKKRKGFVSSVIRELIERRKELKEKLKTAKKISKEWERLNNEQFSIKTIANASYGYFAFSGSKWYCYECAQSAAAFGRFYIGTIIEELERSGFTVIYGDTDSVFVKFEKGDLEKNVSAFLDKINKKLPGILELDLQGFYSRGIFIPRGAAPGTAKKRYALIDDKGTLTIRGLEKVRRDWSNVARDTQEEVLKYVLKDNDVQAAVKYTQAIIQKLKQKKIPLRDLVIYEQLTKPLVEYKQIGPHVVAARKIKDRGRPIGAGMIIMFAITKGKGSISERAEPIEDVSLDDIDINYYINNQILPAALRVLQVLGIDEEKLLGKKTELKRFLVKK